MTLTKKVPNSSGLKIPEIEGKTPRITALAATAALNAIKNEILNVPNLVKNQL